MSKTTILHVQHTFLYSNLSSLHDHYVKFKARALARRGATWVRNWIIYASKKLWFFRVSRVEILHFKHPQVLAVNRMATKVMLNGTIRNDDFWRNTSLQCWSNVVTIRNNVATML